ncbi:MAG TPA: Gfo/Idh/MocA family oxidoreductase [Nocardioidaceae bacterium]
MRVITYGTFDLFHEGHRRLLERARALGDELIVAVTTENFDAARGKLNVRQPLMDRIRNVERCGLADRIIIEEYEGQKVHDIQQYDVDIFAVGSDWVGAFDYLRDYCDVIYLERTQGVSSTELRNESAGIHRLGVVGAGRIADRFIAEARYVSGVDVDGVYARTRESAESFRDRHGLRLAARSYEELLDSSDAIYLATPHETHVDLALMAVERGVHVLAEKPLALSSAECSDLLERATERGVVVMEAIKTAYCPGFQHLVAVARSGAIGQIRSVDATFTRLTPPDVREMHPPFGGAITEFASYPLLAAVKLLGHDVRDMTAYSWSPPEQGVDLFSRIDLVFDSAVASARIGLGVKAEGELVIAGTKGYVYVPAPWWKTEHFEVRFEDQRQNRKYSYRFDGDGLRYEIAEFTSLINGQKPETFKLSHKDSVTLASIIGAARAKAIQFG